MASHQRGRSRWLGAADLQWPYQTCNCVHMLYPGNEPIAEKVAWAESLYRAAGQPPIFRITPLTPGDLEPTLASRGYRVVEPSLVKVGRIDSGCRRHENVLFSNLDNADWIEHFAAPWH